MHTGFQQATGFSSLAKSLKVPINSKLDKLILKQSAPKNFKFNEQNSVNRTDIDRG